MHTCNDLPKFTVSPPHVNATNNQSRPLDIPAKNDSLSMNGTVPDQLNELNKTIHEQGKIFRCFFFEKKIDP